MSHTGRGGGEEGHMGTNKVYMEIKNPFSRQEDAKWLII